MANGNGGQNPHFILEGVTETEAYRYPGGRRFEIARTFPNAIGRTTPRRFEASWLRLAQAPGPPQTPSGTLAWRTVWDFRSNSRASPSWSWPSRAWLEITRASNCSMSVMTTTLLAPLSSCPTANSITSRT